MFPITRQSVVYATRSSDPEVRTHAFGTLIASYWKPVYKYVRVTWHLPVEDAKDLTQEFLRGR